ncbi:thiamine biosynthesis protein ThiJ [Thermoplasmatales archaeon ex4484_30]|nr:MAG: thiamine biosynthesis protein ThiJ [Thermoplasmatales archaeon ex4484_30]
MNKRESYFSTKFKMMLLILMLLFSAGCIEKEKVSIGGKKVLFIIAHENFRDEELFESMDVIENAGGEVFIGSTSLATAHGMKGGEAKPDILIDDIDVKQYDAIIFIGGYGAEIYFSNDTAIKIAKDAYEQNKVIGAICIAPCILAYAGILEQKNATVYPTTKYINILKNQGANFIDKPLVKDGKIITASNPTVAKDFAKAIVSELSNA